MKRIYNCPILSEMFYIQNYLGSLSDLLHDRTWCVIDVCNIFYQH